MFGSKLNDVGFNAQMWVRSPKKAPKGLATWICNLPDSVEMFPPIRLANWIFFLHESVWKTKAARLPTYQDGLEIRHGI